MCQEKNGNIGGSKSRVKLHKETILGTFDLYWFYIILILVRVLEKKESICG